MQNKYNTYANLMTIKTLSLRKLKLFSITRLIEIVRTFGCKLNYKWNYLPSVSVLCVKN